MEEDIYQLFLTNEQGWSLYGTLRLRLVDTEATGGTTIPPMSSPLQPRSQPAAQPTLEPGRAELARIPIEGDVYVPLLWPVRQIPVRGIAYGSAAGLFSIAVDSGATWPRVGIQIFPLAGQDYGALLIWGSSNFTESVFSALARQLPRQS